MRILGVPDDVDPQTVQPKGDWPLSARSRRAHAERDEVRTEALEALDFLSDRELRAQIAADLAVELQEMGGGDPPLGSPNAFTITRAEILECLADAAVIWFVPDIEVVYPGANDPTA
jgi:hypothetical protein